MIEKLNAVLVKRSQSESSPDTDEIQTLAESSGFSVVSVITQKRSEHPEYNIGEGKLTEIHHELEANNANVLIVGNELDPYQMYNIGVYFPSDVLVLDKYTLILELFHLRADTRKSQLEVKLAHLRYELARAETKEKLAKRDEYPGFMGLDEYDESREENIKNQISRIKAKLKKRKQEKESRRRRRREDGFDLVSIAGYTNAGKSTLFRRLSERHSVDENKRKHPDLPKTAVSRDKFFTTLNTTTRTLDFDERDVLLTDTVGLIKDLPHWLIESFNSTFDSIYQSDLILLVVDITNSLKDIRERIVTCHDIFTRKASGRVLTVFNKIDESPQEEVERKLENLQSIVPNAVTISAKTGDGIDELKRKIDSTLPELQRKKYHVPLSDDSMSFISWLHENSHIINKNYNSESVVLDFKAKPIIVKKAQSRLSNLAPT